MTFLRDPHTGALEIEASGQPVFLNWPDKAIWLFLSHAMERIAQFSRVPA